MLFKKNDLKISKYINLKKSNNNWNNFLYYIILFHNLMNYLIEVLLSIILSNTTPITSIQVLIIYY